MELIRKWTARKALKGFFFVFGKRALLPEVRGAISLITSKDESANKNLIEENIREAGGTGRLSPTETLKSVGAQALVVSAVRQQGGFTSLF